MQLPRIRLTESHLKTVENSRNRSKTNLDTLKIVLQSLAREFFKNSSGNRPTNHLKISQIVPVKCLGIDQYQNTPGKTKIFSGNRSVVTKLKKCA